MTGAPDGNWKRTLATADFAGFVKFLTDYCTDSRADHGWKRDDGNATGYGYGFLRAEGEDAAAPARPTLTYSGAPGFPANALRFACSPFTDPQGPQSFAAAQWRIAYIAAPGVPGHKDGARWRYEIEPVWTSAEIAPFANTVAIPAYSITTGMRCRARVRMKDDTGRWSRWSEAVEFTSGPSVR